MPAAPALPILEAAQVLSDGRFDQVVETLMTEGLALASSIRVGLIHARVTLLDASFGLHGAWRRLVAPLR